jgi:hypothetical protein
MPVWPDYTHPPDEPKRGRGPVIAVVAVAVLLAAACGAGGVGSYFLLRSTDKKPSGTAGGAPATSTTAGLPHASADPSGSPAAATGDGPFASAYPAKDISDLDRVCDDKIYYPQSPPRTGAAPHPVVLLIDDTLGRHQDGTYYFSEGLSDSVEAKWAANDPAKVQMVACMDKVSAGAKVRDCKYDDPKPDTATLVHANWRLRVLEVATGRVLLDKSMAGDDLKCPSVVLLGADKQIYAKVSDKAVVGLLRDLVNK